MPASLAKRSISSICFSRSVTLTRTVFAFGKSVVTRIHLINTLETEDLCRTYGARAWSLMLRSPSRLG